MDPTLLLKAGSAILGGGDKGAPAPSGPAIPFESFGAEEASGDALMAQQAVAQDEEERRLRRKQLLLGGRDAGQK